MEKTEDGGDVAILRDLPLFETDARVLDVEVWDRREGGKGMVLLGRSRVAVSGPVAAWAVGAALRECLAGLDGAAVIEE